MYKVEVGLPKESMRYNTWGDFFDNYGILTFQIVDHKNDVYSKFTLIHELIEQTLLEARGFTPEDSDKFDFEFEADPIRSTTYSEPGEDPNCPYKEEHDYADSIIKEMCTKMNINFEDYINDEL